VLDPVTQPRDAGSERHPLRDVLLGAWAGLGPLLATVRTAAPSGPPVASADAELVDVCLGVLAFAWRLEGVFLAIRAAAAPSVPPPTPGPTQRLLR
jgi:hypothetical protein